ncbi:MAG: HNH endonuclease [Pirellulaceae bacterium]
MSHADWLTKVAHLNVYKAKHGLAPHKPLLLLVVIEMAERGALRDRRLQLTPEVAFRFTTLWPIVSYRRTQKPDIRMPFYHLSSQKFWQPFMGNGELSPDKKLTCYVTLDEEFLSLLQSSAFRNQARRILIAKWFLPAERNALYVLYRIPVPSHDEIARDAQFELPDDAKRVGREARFRLDVVPAYDYSCALTGYRVTTIHAGSIVDAAHIHAFKDSCNNDPRNGIALCKNAHWLFDNGLWSIDDDYRIIVAREQFMEESPDQITLKEYHGKKIRLPENVALWPAQRHLSWHRKHCLLTA